MKEKQNWASERPQLENARKLRGIYFIDPENKELICGDHTECTEEIGSTDSSSYDLQKGKILERGNLY